ncbi:MULTISPECIES: TlpA family protein disulfide reductase [Sphingobacterium]|uniref:TlpA family protein disulfide reductase n=1 Tax=Sphingobacterium TaxID=28453 RepID=UPI0013DC4FD7|nr:MULTISPECIES: TlpA disulfide reductase family protein [unclassified Sphingobacterium]
MKYILTILMSMILMVNAKTPYSTVKGSYRHETAKQIKLFTVLNGDMVEYASTSLGPDGSFAFTLIPNDYGFYYIGDEKTYFRVYLIPDQILSVKIDSESNDIALVGTSNPENILVNQWFHILKKMDNMATKSKGILTTYIDFYPELEKVVIDYGKYLDQIKTANIKFNEEMNYLAQSDIRFFALAFLASGRTKHPEKGNITSFHKKVLDEKPLNSQILRLPYAWEYLKAYSSVKRTHMSKNIEGNYTDYLLEQIDGDDLKSRYLLKELAKQKTADKYNAFMKMYGSYFQSADQKNAAQNFGAPLMSTSKGSPAINFIYPDITGKMVSLSDFVGKVVVVDVWATWCGPCIGEIPSLQKLEHEFEGKDVVFMSVSVDNMKHKWEEYLKKNKLTGVQLLGDQAIRDNYKITGIPRFMLFDKKGNIVSVDAPRPSNRLLGIMINEELNK